jgi:hypothetical protein
MTADAADKFAWYGKRVGWFVVDQDRLADLVTTQYTLATDSDSNVKLEVIVVRQRSETVRLSQRL